MNATVRLAMVTWLSVVVSSAPAGAGIAGEQGLSGPRPRSRPGDVPGSRDSRGAGHQLSTVTSTRHLRHGKRSRARGIYATTYIAGHETSTPRRASRASAPWGRPVIRQHGDYQGNIAGRHSRGTDSASKFGQLVSTWGIAATRKHQLEWSMFGKRTLLIWWFKC